MDHQMNTCVMIPAYGESSYLIRCIKSIVEFTPIDIPIYVCDDASPHRTIMEFLIENDVPTSRLNFIRRKKNLGFLGNCNQFFSEVKNINIVLVNSDVIVSTGWIQALMNPLEKYSNVATVTAMTNSGSIASVKLGLEELPELDEVALATLNTAISENTHPENAEIPVGVGHCILITAKALSIVGKFDEMFAPGYGEEVDFSIRATKYGLHHYLANTVVTHFGSKTFGEKSTELKIQHDLLLAEKHPGYLQIVENFSRHSIEIEPMFINVLSKYRGLRILIDARLMSAEGTGTSRLIENTLNVLCKDNHLRISILLRDENLNFWKKRLPSNAMLISKKEIEATGQYFDIVYSPSQISEEETMFEYRFWGRRVVIQQLDFIAFDNWKYFASPESYTRYRNAVARTYAEADAVLYISEYVGKRADKLFKRASPNYKVIYCGTDHFLESTPADFEAERILVIGAGFAHKNQKYALEIFNALKSKLRNPKLVFVGPKPTFGFDSDFWEFIEKGFSDSSIQYYRWLSDDDLQIQISKAQLILYPTTSEGFGFIPFEAAKMRRATLFNLNTSLSEFFEEVPTRLIYSLDTDVETIYDLLTKEDSYNSQVNFISEVGKKLTWNHVGNSLTFVFENVILTKRYLRDLSPSMDTRIDLKFHFLKNLGSRKIVIYFFPFSSYRRTRLVAILKKRFQ
jgi:GT2 family glycosyltransferase